MSSLPKTKKPSSAKSQFVTRPSASNDKLVVCEPSDARIPEKESHTPAVMASASNYREKQSSVTNTFKLAATRGAYFIKKFNVLKKESAKHYIVFHFMDHMGQWYGFHSYFSDFSWNDMRSYL